MDILVIGNSFSYFAPRGNASLSPVNQLKAMAAAAGTPITTTTAAAPGGNIEAQWNDTGFRNAQGEIKSGKYEFVLIGGDPNFINDGLVDNPAGKRSFNQYADRFSDLADANDVKTVFYTNWAGDWFVDIGRINGGDPFGTSNHNSYRAAAARNDDAYAPVGLAYSEAYRQITALFGNGDNGQTAENLLSEDQLHPTSMMAYLAASVWYETIFGKSPPASYRPSFVTQVEAQRMRNIAEDAVDSYAILVDGTTTPTPPPPPPPPPPSGNGGTLAGRYFVDADGDNVEDRGEPGVSGATVELMQGNRVVDTTTTAANGTYSFDGLDRGYYGVRFAADAQGRDFVRGNSGGNDSVDSDVWKTDGAGRGITSNFQITPTQSMRDADAGIVVNGSPTPPPPPPPSGNGGTLAGRYFRDADGDNIEDRGEAGVAGATVELISGARVVATTQTDASGRYSFDGLDRGYYAARFAADPAGGDFARGNVGGDDRVDSDVWKTDGAGRGLTSKFLISNGQSMLDADAGATGSGGSTPTPPPTPVSGGAVSGRYFIDRDGDYLEDAGEPGVRGLGVDLLRGGRVVESTRTASDGSYSFDGLSDGFYFVRFEADRGGRDFVKGNVGRNDAIDSDVWRFEGDGDGLTGAFRVTSARPANDVDVGIETGQMMELPTDAFMF